MFRYISRRLVQTVFTVLGVMLITFVLFRIIAGDVSSSYVNSKLGVEAKRSFNEKHKLDRPGVFNFHKRLELVDQTGGEGTFSVRDSGSLRVVRSLGLHLAPYQPQSGAPSKDFLRIVGNPVYNLGLGTPLSKMVTGNPVAKRPPCPGARNLLF